MKPAAVYVALLWLAALLAGGAVQAQTERTVRLVVLDSTDRMPIAKATVAWLPSGKGLSNEKGQVHFTTTADTVRGQITSTGYTNKLFVFITAKRPSHTDTILLVPSATLMEEIIVTAAAPPVVFKGDTTEFNIDSAMFRPYDVVSDLLKRLPGLEIDAAGRMSYQGKPINRILVDGEDLFGGGAGLSLSKLPAGMVAKIQVMDTKTLEQVLHNQLTDGEEKTLNIQLKKGNKIFGAAEGTIGSRNQLDGGLHLNSFDEQRRLNLAVASRSSNKLGWAARQNGPVVTATNGSLGYGNRWGKLNVNGNYSINRNTSINEVLRERTQVITADTSLFTRSRNLVSNASTFHNTGVHTLWQVDSANTLDANVTLSQGRSNNRTQSALTTTENGALRNESYGRSSGVNDNQQFASNFLWAKRFKKRERGLSVTGRAALSNTRSENANQSTNTYFKGGVPVNGDTVNRVTITTGTVRSYSIGANYTDYLGKHFLIRLRADADFNTTSTGRSLYNVDSNTKEAVLDSSFSADIVSITATQNLNAAIEYFSTKKWRISSGLGAVLQQVERQLQGTSFGQRLVRYTPSINTRYSISPTKLLRIDFTANTQQPTIEQLQPVPDNSNPLYVRVGNPALRTAFAQNYVANYTSNSATDKRSKSDNRFSANLGYSPISNQIINAVYYDEFRRQTSKYINVDGVYTLRAGAGLYKTLRREKRWTTWNASGSGDYGQQAAFQSNQLYYTRTYNWSSTVSLSRNEQTLKPTSYTVGLTTTGGRTWVPGSLTVLNTTRLSVAPKAEGSYQLVEGLYATVAYRLAYNRINYHSTLRGNDEYNTHFLSQHLDYAVDENFSLSSDFNYTYNTRVPAGAPKGIPSLNLHASAELGKGKARAELSANNLLAPAQTFQRSVTDTFIEDVQINTLRNYFTLRVQYNMNRLQKRGSKTRPFK